LKKIRYALRAHPANDIKAIAAQALTLVLTEQDLATCLCLF